MENSPLSNLPFDIYAEIFLEYAASNPFNPWSPLVLSAVNSSWRLAALHLPRLWSNVPLCGDEIGYHLLNQQDPFYRMIVEGSPGRTVTKGCLWRGLTRAEDLKEWLRRSAESSLKVSYTQPLRTSPYGDWTVWKKIPAPDFFHVFRAARGRVTELKLVRLRISDHSDESEAVKAFTPSAFPKLERLVLDKSCRIGAYFEEPLPSIRYLDCSTSSISDPAVLITDMTRRLSGLVSCNLVLWTTFDSDLVTFCNKPTLEEVAVNLDNTTNYKSISNTPSNSQIKRLHIRQGMWKRHTILKELHLPKLQVLSWSNAYDIRPSHIRFHLKRLLQTSSPPLNTLTFSSIQIKDKTLIESLEVLPTLRYLKLHTTAVTDDAIEALKDSDRGLCPELMSLDVNVKKSLYGWQRISGTALKSLKDVRDRLEVFYNDDLL